MGRYPCAPCHRTGARRSAASGVAVSDDGQGAPLEIAPARDVDLPAIDAYLAARSDTCMLLRGNLRAAGLAWTAPDGVMPQGHYTLAWRAGAVIGVVGHAWSGTVLIQADAHAGELAAAAVASSGRRSAGYSAPRNRSQKPAWRSGSAPRRRGSTPTRS